MAFPLLILSDLTLSCGPVQPLAASATLSLTTAPLWHSSALSLMDRLASVPSAPGKHRLGLDISDRAPGASTPNSSFLTHWDSCQARSGAPFLVQG